LFTNRVRAIRNTISNPDHYRAIRDTVANPDRYRAIGKTVTSPDSYRAIGKTVANREHYRRVRKTVSNPHHYPAAVLAVAAVAVGVAPLTASAASSSSAAASPVAAVAAAPQAAASTTGATSTTTTGGTTNSTPQAAKPSTTTSTPAPAKTQPSTPAPAQTQKTQSTKQTEQTKAAPPANPWAGTSIATLEPNGLDGYQSYITLDSAQWVNATTIVDTAQNLHMSPYAATIAVATSMQESKLLNLTVAVDHDSLGLFQQRPSTGWGSPSELTDPTYAATAFLKSLPSNYQSMQLDDAAQQVQRSFDGQLYAQWEDQAAHIVQTIVDN
jgi:hypothetical protein